MANDFPTDLRSLRLRLVQAEEAEAAIKEQTRRIIDRVARLKQHIKIREWQEEPHKREAIEDLVDEANQCLTTDSGSSALEKACERVKALLDE